MSKWFLKIVKEMSGHEERNGMKTKLKEGE